MAAEISSYQLDQMFSRIRKKRILYSLEFQALNPEEIDLFKKFKQELNEKLKSIRKSLENND